ncbi:MAG: SpoIIE family protein phosphatase, partial [Planctomycetes bacterium]|nr:SpoIIE family protein phosphatase [Planctomycetota bacterium]
DGVEGPRVEALDLGHHPVQAAAVDHRVDDVHLAPAALVKQVRKSVTSFAAGARQSDDITILAARVS